MEKTSEMLCKMYDELMTRICKELEKLNDSNQSDICEIRKLREHLRESVNEQHAIKDSCVEFAKSVNAAMDNMNDMLQYNSDIVDALDEMDNYELECENCGELIPIGEKPVIKDGHIYCCEECMEEAEEENEIIDYCSMCGDPIHDGDEVFEDDYGNVFCSESCLEESGEQDDENEDEEESEESEE